MRRPTYFLCCLRLLLASLFGLGVCAHHQLASAQSYPPVQHQQILLGLQYAQGLSAEHMATSLRRRHLSSKAQLECAALDTQLPTLKRQARRAPPETKAMQQERLKQAKARFAQLGC